MKRKMTTARAQTSSINSVAIDSKDDTLYPGTLGHIRWLLDRGNKTLSTGKMDINSVGEICFAYSTDPEGLQKFKGPRAKAVLDKFMIRMTPDRFSRLQAHAETELMKYIKTLTTPKKPTAQVSRKPAARARKR